MSDSIYKACATAEFPVYSGYWILFKRFRRKHAEFTQEKSSCSN